MAKYKPCPNFENLDDAFFFSVKQQWKMKYYSSSGSQDLDNLKVFEEK